MPILINPIDRIWLKHSKQPVAPVYVHPLEWAGQNMADKLSTVCTTIKQHKAEAALVSNLGSIAWLLNCRGGDIPFTPVMLAYALVYADQTIDLFIEPQKISSDLKHYFGSVVTLYPYDALAMKLQHLGKHGRTVLIDAKRAPYQIILSLEQSGGQVIRADDICLQPKACKNDCEVAGMRQAHIKDAVALIHFLAWLDETSRDSNLKMTELDIVAQLRHYRDQQGVIDDSFSTIAGSGPNGAIIHYHASAASNRLLQSNDLLLLDSGGQYQEGTTDVTRTLSMGLPTAEQKDRFTRVLKGHIGLASAKFPRGTTGHQLDSLARYWLWQAGFDYAHGTGHGVGSFLFVHEGPQSISSAPNSVPLQPGMVLSNEPGYYKSDAYGIRIEGLMVVKACVQERNFENEMLYFEMLTLVPIDFKLIDYTLLDRHEKQWLNDYHIKIQQTIGDLLQPFAKKWLARTTVALE